MSSRREEVRVISEYGLWCVQLTHTQTQSHSTLTAMVGEELYTLEPHLTVQLLILNSPISPLSQTASANHKAG
jgi:hypothetical protein